MSGVLAEVHALGPHFMLSTGPRTDAAGFLPLAEVYATRGDLLARYAEHVAEVIGTDQPRVAASTLHLGTVSRLASISLAAAAFGGPVPDLDPQVLHWRAPAGVVELWLPEVRQLPLADDPVEPLRTTLAAHLTPLDECVHRRWRLSRQVLRGNAGSAVVGATGVLQRSRPDVGPRAVALAAELLAREPFAGAGEFAVANEKLDFVRHSCCLYYRVRGAGTCGDCVLRERRRPRVARW